MPSHVARPPNDSTTAEVQIWRTITLGTNKGVAAYREGLDAAAIKIGVSADEILGRPAVPYARMKTQVELALLSVAELGVEAEAASFPHHRSTHRCGGRSGRGFSWRIA